MLPRRASTRAPRWATCRSARASSVTPMQMAAAYARDRQRRHPAPAARHRAASAASRSPQPRGRRIISAATAAELRTMLEGVLAPGRHRQRGRDPRLQAGRQDRHREQDRPGDRRVLEDAYVASFVGFAPAPHPKLLIVGHGRRAPGRDLRRRGRGAGVRQDRRASRCPYLRHPAASRARTRGEPRLRLTSPRCSARSSATSRTRRRSRSRALAYDNRARAARHAVLLRARASRATATTSPPTAVARGAVGARRRASAGARRARGPRRRRPRRDGARGRALPRRPDRAADDGRGHRDQRQDDDGLPGARAARGGGAAAPGCSAP